MPGISQIKGVILRYEPHARTRSSRVFSPDIFSPFLVQNERLTVSIQLSKTVKWLEQADFEAKIVIAGIVDSMFSPSTPYRALTGAYT